uniref:Uncharacterized protein n=1 Tax=Manihot esculenta TaxID=3983 RepID=A0A2C9WHP1_MANES
MKWISDLSGCQNLAMPSNGYALVYADRYCCVPYNS